MLHLHTILVFIHVMSAVGLSASALISLLGLLAMQRAQRVEQVRAVIGLLALSEPIAGVTLVLTPLAGLIMTITTWGWQNGWINVALGSMALLLLVGAIIGTRRRAIANLIKDMPDGSLPESLILRLHDPLMGSAGYMMVAIVVGIVFLMTTKPMLDGSLIAMVTAVVLGMLASLPIWRGPHGH
jgi:hypothetical protein